MRALRKNSEWKKMEKKLCRVIKFTPVAKVENDGVIASDRSSPYASVDLDCEGERIKGFVTHKEDFKNLWKALKEDDASEEHEVIITWTNGYKNFLFQLLAFMLPKLQVMVCKKGSFELMINQKHRPELTGEARALEQRPLVWLKSDVME